MKKVHSGKPAVCGKISKGEASKEEKELAVKMYEGLVKTKPPKLHSDNFGGQKYSDDYFVDAICRIRRP